LCSNSSRNKNSRYQRKAGTGRLKKLAGHEGEARMPPLTGQSKALCATDSAKRAAIAPTGVQRARKQCKINFSSNITRVDGVCRRINAAMLAAGLATRNWRA
jgi:hypothetical protein